MGDRTNETGVQGQRIGGRFELIERLGSGGYGSVWRAHDRREGGDEVALKLVRAHRRGDPAVVTRFEREAQALQRLIHPNTVRLRAFGQDDGGVYLALELLEGESLGARLGRGETLASDQVHALGMAVLHALAEAHALGIVHRDIKPDNLFLMAQGGVKVLDWGLVKALDEALHDVGEGAVTQQGVVVGSLAYMPPERVSGQPATTAGDVYALGCTLFAALTGGPPYTGVAGKAALARAHQHAQVPRPVVGGVTLGGPLVDVIAAMMAKEPSERLATVPALVRLAGLRSPLVHVAASTDEDASVPNDPQSPTKTVALPVDGAGQGQAAQTVMLDEAVV